MSGVRGIKRNTMLSDEVLRILSSRVNTTYDADEFALGIVVGQSLKGRLGSLLFTTVPIAHFASIRSDQTITVRYVMVDGTNGPTFTVEGGVPHELDRVEFTDIKVSTTAATNNLSVITA